MRPLSVLLSQVLVAFAIEFDNEFEHLMLKTWARPFRVSIVMWSNFMRFVREAGTPVGEIVTASCVPKENVASVVGGMERWGYITVGDDRMRKGFGTGRGVREDTVVRPSQTGELALRVWEKPLVAEIESRWKDRIGEADIEDLRDALADIESRVGLVMPHFLPVVGASGLFADKRLESGTSAPDRDLPALLSRVLLAFTLDYEADPFVSLPIGANVLRVADADGVRIKDLPLATGVSKEAVSMSLTWLERNGYVAVEPDPKARGKIVRAASQALDAQEAHRRRLGELENDWNTRYGKDEVGAVRERLQHILDQPGGEDGPLSSGLVTPPGGWRGTGRYKPLTAAFIDRPSEALPTYPMVLHRGGWPDGS